MRIALGIEYDGGAFNGFQYQTHAPSVQGALQDALSQVADAPITLTAAGRTDTGVHATYQVVAFDTPVERPLDAWVRGTNTLSPDGVGVLWARARCPTTFIPGFRPRPDATCICSTIWRRCRRCWHSRVTFSRPLADEKMHSAACRPLMGEQDFSAFRAAGCQSNTPMRAVHQVSVSRVGGFVLFDITANAFLLHMVRNIAGSLLGNRPGPTTSPNGCVSC